MDTKEVIARFEQERQALAMMDHPNIAKVHDAGATPTGRPFFVMELVRGPKITEYCDQANLPTADRLALFISVCQAVQHAHQKGIIHRDLKPSNILVTLHDGVPVPKVIDFGVAKATEQQRLTDLTLFTQFEQMIGTPLYMSPEQAEMSGLDIDTRSDIYSLGVLLYELLTGRTPFDPEELMRKGHDEIRRAIREQEPQKPSTALHTMAVGARTTIAQHRQADGAKLTGLMRGDLDWIVMKALEKDRTRRYETANGLALDIKRHLDNEPVLARPASSLYRFRRLVRRNKLAFIAATAVAVALVAGMGISSWQAFAAWKAQRETEVARTGEQQQRLEAESQARKASASEQQSRRFLYASDINLAQQSLKLNNLGKARRLLERHRPRSGEEDLRRMGVALSLATDPHSALSRLRNGQRAESTSAFHRMAAAWRWLYDGTEWTCGMSPAGDCFRTLTDSE
jgi:serine/threonine protein kinase